MTALRFDGKVAIVTGAGGGLGKAYATLLAARGAQVLVNDLESNFTGEGSDPGYAAAAAAEMGAAGGVAVANGDSVATREGADRIVAHALQLWGQVDILINNAGVVTSTGPISGMTDQQWDTDLRVAATGTFQMCRAVWQHMWDRNYGRVLNVSSGSFFGMGSGVGYPASKGAVWGITRGLSSTTDHHRKNIRINCIMPTAASRMTHLMGDEVASGMQREFPPEAAAPMAAYLVHDEVPCNGEMFRIGGRSMRRVFVGVAPGYRSSTFLDMETVRDHFAEIMAADGYIIPKNNIEALDATCGVNWSAFMAGVI